MSNRLSTPTQQPEAGAEKAPRQKPKPKPKRKPFILQRLRRQEIFLLTGLLSLACFSVIVVGLLILRFQSAAARPELAQPTNSNIAGPQPTYTVTFVEITALSQYRLAEAEARRLASDAQLVSANANWPGVLNVEQVGAPSQWTYDFFSPSKEHLLIVKVEPDGQLEAIEHVARITLPPPVLGEGDWVIDSPAALAIWLDNGGAELVQSNPGLEVLIQLRHLNDYPNPVWAVIGTDTRTQSIHIVVIDTIEGTVVTRKSSG